MGNASIKLGIIVVYLVDDDNEKLLDIHLHQIKENTSSQFTLYACVNMLQPKFVNKLKQYKFIRPIVCKDYIGPNDETRGAKEHSHYLTQLIEIAIKDSASHMAIFHPDSFPINLGWDQKYLNQLIYDTDLISIFPHMTGFMFFHKNFYRINNPSLLPSPEDEASQSWLKFQKTNNVTNLSESGMGFAYYAYLNKQNWIKLSKSTFGDNHHRLGSFSNNYIFHLGSASDYRNRPMRDIAGQQKILGIKDFISKILPNTIKNIFKRMIPQKILFPEIKENKDEFLKTRDMLLNNTSNFLKSLKTGNIENEV